MEGWVKGHLQTLFQELEWGLLSFLFVSRSVCKIKQSPVLWTGTPLTWLYLAELHYRSPIQYTPTHPTGTLLPPQLMISLVRDVFSVFLTLFWCIWIYAQINCCIVFEWMVKNIFALRIMCTNKKCYKENAFKKSGEPQTFLKYFYMVYIYKFSMHK